MAQRGLNKVMVIGNLGGDPETRYLPSGACTTTFSVATSESWKDKQTGEEKERTEWIRIECWGRTAENCAEYLRKGSQVYAEGSLRTDKWQDDKGIDRWTTVVRADRVQFLSSSGGGGGRSQPKQQPATDEQQDFDDDIPF